MSGPYYVELENNHHYILVNEETGRSYYTPAQDDANEICRITFEIKRKFPERFDEHVAFVTNEDLAFEFCEKHKDCYYHEIHITKYRNELEAQRGEVPCCESCDYISPQVKSDGSSITWCNHHQQETNQDEYCSDWEREP